jgi:acyl transferase domain-containing protein
MAIRCPGAANVDEFWSNLKNGVESVSFFSDEELRKAGISDAVL